MNATLDPTEAKVAPFPFLYLTGHHDPKLTDQEVGDTLNKYRQTLMAKQHEKFIANKAAGQAFLDANKSKPGVMTLTNGLQYKVIAEGSGESPGLNDTALVNYRGTLIDGTEFDSSAKAGKPVPFELKGIIPGFKEALQLMTVGSKWQIVVPSNLAYGERGAGNVIGPNSTLIFEIELVGIQDNP
jgi:FKBP-type peptidyl-prolyl cis-trans isomerase FklB